MTLLADRLSSGLAGRYRLEREIGSGAAAHVYLAEDVRHRRNVAIKVLRPELATTVAGERFLREIEIAGQLLHPHILGIIDSGEVEGLLFYVMPYVAGETLRERLDREHDLPIDEALRIVRDVADALAYAHRRGVVHRDIKPDNVLLFEQHALVADFGIARAIVTARQAHDADMQSNNRITAPGVSLGTPAYMAPEQAAGESDVDHRADLYGLGILAYELLVGEPPFTGPTAQHVIAAQVARHPVPPSQVRRTVPGGVERLVMRCLEKRPADRWQSAAEFVHALDMLRAVEQAHAAEPRLILRERRFRLTEEVCRRMNRATLDPRIIGADVLYLDNQVPSDVLVIYLHGMGLDHTYFEPALRLATHRAIAPSLFGFAPASPRVPLSIDSHAAILSELIRDVTARERPALTVLAGFSSGADLAFHLVNLADPDRLLPVDGLLSLGCNLSLETCFVSRPFADLEDQTALTVDLMRGIDTHVQSVQEWVSLHDYLVRILRKFAGDLAPLQRHASDIVRAFTGDDPHPFDRWYREAAPRLRAIRCVFEETPLYTRLVQEMRLRNIDHGALGPHYREDSIVMEPATEHFGLTDPALVQRHLDALVASARTAREPAPASASLRSAPEPRIGA